MGVDWFCRLLLTARPKEGGDNYPVTSRSAWPFACLLLAFCWPFASCFCYRCSLACAGPGARVGVGVVALKVCVESTSLRRLLALVIVERGSGVQADEPDFANKVGNQVSVLLLAFCGFGDAIGST